MFRCYFCQKVTPPKTTRHTVVIETREKQYSTRRREPKRGGFRNREDSVQDRGGSGVEIIKEVDACPECAAKQHQVKSVPLAPPPAPPTPEPESVEAENVEAENVEAENVEAESVEAEGGQPEILRDDHAVNASNLEILAYEETPLGPVCLRRRELLSKPGVSVTEVTLNHEFLMSSYNTDSERELAKRAVEIHGSGKLAVLVGGLGLGYTARELISNSNVESVEVVEYLPQVVQWVRDGLVPLSGELSAAANLRMVHGDIYERLRNPPQQKFDLIVIDVDHSPDDQLGDDDHQFYTEQGLEKAKTHLRDGGVLAVWSYAESSSFSGALRSVFPQVDVVPVQTTNDLVGHEQTDWLFFGSG